MADHGDNDAPPTTAFGEGLGGAKPSGISCLTPDPECVSKFRLTRYVELPDVPGLVVPLRFSAEFGHLDYPAVVTLHISVYRRGPLVRLIETRPRLDYAESEEIMGLGYPWDEWAFVTPEDSLGQLPSLPVPTLLRESLAYAAVPHEDPHMAQMGKHRATALAAMRARRARRLSKTELILLRKFAHEAADDPTVTTQYQRLAFIHDRMHKALPEQWPNDERGRLPDYYRVKPHVAKIDRENAVSITVETA